MIAVANRTEAELIAMWREAPAEDKPMIDAAIQSLRRARRYPHARPAAPRPAAPDRKRLAAGEDES